MISRKLIIRSFVLFVVLISSLSFAAQTAKITVENGETHVFDGFGASSINRRDFQTLPEEMQNDLATHLWGDPNLTGGLGFNVLRCWVTTSATLESFQQRYSSVYNAIKKVNPDTKVLIGPGGVPTTPEAYCSFFANFIGDIVDAGYEVYATGVANEPSANKAITEGNIATFVKLFRQGLDSRGLQEKLPDGSDNPKFVRVIGPEEANVDVGAMNMIQNILDDPEANAGLWAVSTHSYNMCVIKWLRDVVMPTGKKHWQTECSANGPENNHDSIRAVYGVSRAISDINLLCNSWVWFIGWAGYDERDNATRIMGYNATDATYSAFRKYFYFRSLTKTYDVGAGVRLCLSDLDRDPTDGQEDRGYKYMENWYGQKPPICAGAVVNPDGSWGFAVANQTGLPADGDLAIWPAADVYNVTYHVTELEGSGGRTFDVMRIKREGDTYVNYIAETIAIDNNGEFTVTVNPTEIVVLRDEFNMKFSSVEQPPEPGDYGTCGMGIGFALLPPIGIKLCRIRRKKRKN